MWYNRKARKHMMPRMGVNGIMINGQNSGGSGGGNANQNANQNQNGQNNGQNNNTANNTNSNSNQNNNTNQLDDFAGMWNTDPAENENQNQNQNTQNNQNNQPAAEPDYNEMFDKHVKSLNLTQGIDGAKVLDAINRGDADALNTAFAQIGANAYRHAMLNADRMMGQRLEKAKAEFQRESNGAMRASKAVDKMFDALPFTKHPATQPLAKATLAQMMQKHNGDIDKAVAETERYFKTFSEHMGKNFNTPPQSRNGRGNRPNNDGYDNSNDEEADWLSILGGPQQ